MIQGLYLSAQGAKAQSIRMELTANNLANASTTGFKRDLAIYQVDQLFQAEQGRAESDPKSGREQAGGVSLADIATDFASGELQETGGPLDLALNGPGFFKVGTVDEKLLTRDGRFVINASGELVTEEKGIPVQTTDGSPLFIPPEVQELQISTEGVVTATRPNDPGRVPLGRLAVVQPDDFSRLQKLGNNLYRADTELRPAGLEVSVQQGYLEMSGTKPVVEMMDMIQNSRVFESNINLMKLQDDSLGRLLQTMNAR